MKKRAFLYGAAVLCLGVHVVAQTTDPYVPVEVTVVATVPETVEPIPGSLAPERPAVCTVSRTGPTDVALEVFVRLYGSATNGEDYREVPEQVTIPAGESAAPIYILALHDDVVEGDEVVAIQVLPPVCPAIYPPPPWCYMAGNPDVARVVIHDNDGPPVNQPPDAAITRPTSGSVFPAPATISVTTEVNDPDGWVQTVELFANNRKIDEQSIFFIVPPPPGQDQVFTFEWERVPAGHYALQARATDDQGASSWSAPVRIVVGEMPSVPVVNIWATDPFAREELSPYRPRNRARFRVRRSGPVDQPLSVDYMIGGTATNGEDYRRLPGQVTIPAGRYSAPITIVPIDDEVPEGVETVVLGLFVAVDVEPPPYRVGRRGKAGAIIIDRDRRMPPCRRLRDGLIHITRTAQDGEIVDVQATDRLGGEWESVGTMTVVDGAIHFVDPEAPDHPFRCYRFVPRPANSVAAAD